MICADKLREFRPQVRCENARVLNLGLLQNAIRNYANRLGISVAFRDDQIKSGGFSNPSIDDCVVMYHPDHEKDYFKFCICVKSQGLYTCVAIYDFGGENKQKLENELQYYQAVAKIFDKLIC